MIVGTTVPTIIVGTTVPTIIAETNILVAVPTTLVGTGPLLKNTFNVFRWEMNKKKYCHGR